VDTAIATKAGVSNAQPVLEDRTFVAYQPLENYGFIGDLHTVALAGVDGSIDYMCFPNFDSPTVFGALLDDDLGGRFKIAPTVDGSRYKQMYLPDTNVLLTRFLGVDGVVEITDFMPVEEMRHTHILIRRVHAVRGPVDLHLECAPRFDYARVGHRAKAKGDEVWFIPDDGNIPTLRLLCGIPVDVVDGDAVVDFTLQSGESVDFVLETVESEEQSPAEASDYVEKALQHSMQFWRGWSTTMSYRGRWQDMISRSALTLKLLTSQKYGSIAAAGTFGIPEEIGGERNWDYRFTWVRDASFTAASLIRLGFTEEARGFMRWIEQRFGESDTPGKLQIMYGIDGRHDLTEETLDHLSGYRDSAPVRIGNGAYDQTQLDIYGELLYTVNLYDEQVEPISYALWKDLSVATDWVCDHWRDTDEGIWEVRGGQREFLYSRLTDWVALDRAIRIAQRRSFPAPLTRWLQVRDDIHNEIYTGFWSEQKQAFVQSKGSDTLDASALMMPLIDFIASRDPRWLSTLDAVEKELVDDALVYRYRPDAAASDGLEGAEGTFGICSFWFVECLARSGQVDKARLFFEKLHGYANHLGLYAEELDPSGRFLGNYPQAFTHLALVNSALYLNEALERQRR
jgi:GH15 family glucan-1,4-alpha-glucosidase